MLTLSKAFVQLFIEETSFSSSSAFFGSFQKPGSFVSSSFSFISLCLPSMSKIPPQRIAASCNVFYLVVVNHCGFVCGKDKKKLRAQSIGQGAGGKGKPISKRAHCSDAQPARRFCIKKLFDGLRPSFLVFAAFSTIT